MFIKVYEEFSSSRELLRKAHRLKDIRHLSFVFIFVLFSQNAHYTESRLIYLTEKTTKLVFINQLTS